MTTLLDVHFQPATLLIGLFVAVITYTIVKMNTGRKNLPPSPPGALPVIGHTLTMAKSTYPWRTFQ